MYVEISAKECLVYIYYRPQFLQVKLAINSMTRHLFLNAYHISFGVIFSVSQKHL